MPRHPYDESDPGIFPRLDAAELRRMLAVAKKGRDRGRANLPLTDNRELDEAENEIIAVIEGEKVRSHGIYRDQIDTYRKRLASLGVEPLLPKLFTAADEARTEFLAKCRSGGDELLQVGERVRQVDEEISRFKERHGLARLPRLPGSRLLKLGLLVSLVLVEGILNGSFLALGHELGFTGGILEALVIASVNVIGGATVGGWPARYVVHRSPRLRLMGVAAVLAFLLAIGAFNLGVGHYRDALVAAEVVEAAPAIAWQSFISDPLAVADLKSWLLSVLGLFFSLVAFFDAYSMDDPYPGYGRLARLRRRILDEYHETRSEVAAELAAVKDEMLRRIDEAVHAVDARRNERQEIGGRVAGLANRFRAHLDHLEGIGGQLLAEYREANRRARTTAPPGHFGESWRMTRPEVETIPAEEIDLPEAAEDRVREAFAKAEAIRREILKHYEDALRRYQTIDELIARRSADE